MKHAAILHRLTDRSFPLLPDLNALSAFLHRGKGGSVRIITEPALWDAGLLSGVTALLDEQRIPWDMRFAPELLTAPEASPAEAILCIGGHGAISLPGEVYGKAQVCHLPMLPQEDGALLHLIAHGLMGSLDRSLSRRSRAASAAATADLIRAMQADTVAAAETAVVELARAIRGATDPIHLTADALGSTHAPDVSPYDAHHGEGHYAATCLLMLHLLNEDSDERRPVWADIAQAANLCAPGAGDDVSASLLQGWFRDRCEALHLPETYTHIARKDVYGLALQVEKASHGRLSRFDAERRLLTVIAPEEPLRDVHELVDAQRAFFRTDATLPLSYRRDALLRLQQYVRTHEDDIHAALKADLGKCTDESYLCETGMVLSEVRHMLAHLSAYARTRHVPSPAAQFPSRSLILKRPFGVALIMSPWNYPFLLTVGPLIGAIAAGCCAVVKPSAYAPNTSKLLREMIRSCYPQAHIAVVEGGRTENQALLDQHFDKIFFTGGGAVGREVLRKAAEHLTPVTLELGGKSPVVVDETANIPVAARRIAFGKLLNCGQTCVAPDYILVHKAVHNELVDCLKEEFTRMAGPDALQNDAYPHMISPKHYDRVMGLIDPTKVVLGGRGDMATLRIQPTVMEGVTPDDAVMQQEIFGPVLPILEVESVEEAIAFIRDRDTPLACYLFTEDRKVKRDFLRRVPFGGGCVNDTIIHLATSKLPFGGMGASGMGRYHGQYSFDCFSHTGGVVDKATWLDLPMRYAPYSEKMMKMVRFFLR